MRERWKGRKRKRGGVDEGEVEGKEEKERREMRERWKGERTCSYIDWPPYIPIPTPLQSVTSSTSSQSRCVFVDEHLKGSQSSE